MIMLTNDRPLTVTERVCRGAALLDRMAPGWWAQIETSRLSIANCRTCLLGQVFGSYLLGCQVLGFKSAWVHSAGRDPVNHGFAVSLDSGGWVTELRDLTGAWITEVEKRKAKRVESQQRVKSERAVDAVLV